MCLTLPLKVTIPLLPLPTPSQLLVLLRHGAFCDEQGRYACALARHNAAAYEEALAYEMQAAAQSSAYGERFRC